METPSLNLITSKSWIRILGTFAFIAILVVQGPTGTSSFAHPPPENPSASLLAQVSPSFVPASIGTPPGGMVFDNGNNLLYASAPSYGSVLVINITTKTVVGNITVGTDPIGITLGGNSRIFVVNNGSGNVSVINTSSNAVIASIPVGLNPTGIADCGGSIYVANFGSNNVSVFNDATFGSRVSIRPIAGPFGVACGASGGVGVTQPGHNSVTVISGIKVTGKFGVGSDPIDISTGPPGTGYLVANRGSNNLTLIGGFPHNINVGPRPRGVGYDSYDSLVYVANTGSRGVSVLRAGTLVATLYTDDAPGTISIDSGTGFVYVGGFSNGTLSNLPPDIDQSIVSLPAGPGPNAVVVLPGTDTYCIADSADSELSLVNATSWLNYASIRLPGPASSLLLVAPDDRLYASIPRLNEVVGIDPISTAIVASIAVGSSPSGLAFDSTSGNLYVSNSRSNNITLVNTTREVVVGSIGAGNAPMGIAFSTGNAQLAVANEGSNNVSLINPITGVTTGRVQVGSSPTAVTFAPSPGAFYVVNTGSDNVTEIARNRIVRSVPVGNQPQSVAYDPSNGQIYVSNNASGNVSIFAAVSGLATGSTPDLNATAVAVDMLRNVVVATLYNLSSISIIEASRNYVTGVTAITLPTTTLGYLPGNDDLYISAIHTLLVIHGVNGTYSPLFTRSFGVTEVFPEVTVGEVETLIPDPVHNALYVSYKAGGTTVLNGSTNLEVGGVAINNIQSAADDPLTGEIYTSSGLVINTSSQTQGAPIPAASGTAVVTNPITGDAYFLSGSSIEVMNASSRTITQTISLAISPKAEVVNPNGKSLELLGGRAVSELNLSSGTIVRTVNVSNPTSQVIYDPAMGALLVSDNVSHSIEVINLTSYKVIRTLHLDDRPTTMAFLRTSGSIAVLSSAAGTVEFLWASNGTPRRILQFGSGPGLADGRVLADNEGVLISPAVSLTGAHNFSALNGITTFPSSEGFIPGIATSQVLNSVIWLCANPKHHRPCHDPAMEQLAVGRDPTGIAIDSNSSVREVFVADTGSDQVTILHYNLSHYRTQPAGTYLNLTNVGNLSVGLEPSSILFDSTNGLAYVANSGGDNVSIINPVTRAVVGSITVGSNPRTLLLDPTSGLIYVANSGSDNISVFSTSTNSVVTTMAVPGGPETLFFGSTSSQLYVGCWGSGDIVELQNGAVVQSYFVGGNPIPMQFVGNYELFILNTEASVVQALFYGS
jgi:YVTN family beta-propeller protein